MNFQLFRPKKVEPHQETARDNLPKRFTKKNSQRQANTELRGSSSKTTLSNENSGHSRRQSQVTSSASSRKTRSIDISLEHPASTVSPISPRRILSSSRNAASATPPRKLHSTNENSGHSRHRSKTSSPRSLTRIRSININFDPPQLQSKTSSSTSLRETRSIDISHERSQRRSKTSSLRQTRSIDISSENTRLQSKTSSPRSLRQTRSIDISSERSRLQSNTKSKASQKKKPSSSEESESTRLSKLSPGPPRKTQSLVVNRKVCEAQTPRRSQSVSPPSSLKTSSSGAHPEIRRKNSKRLPTIDTSPTRTMKKSCSFSGKIEVIHVPSLTEDPKDLWFQKADYSAFKKNCQRILNYVDANGLGKNGKKYCMLGLERYKSPSRKLSLSNDSRRNYRRTILKVLEKGEDFRGV